MELISSYSFIQLFRRKFGRIYVFLNIEVMIHGIRSHYHRPLKGRGICIMNDPSIKENEIPRVRYTETRSLERSMKRGPEGV
uniref:Uncharacterized protein n=1 Tax=Lepeophtheirus salmonis TaxID=72036 RepID=A0A0K2U5N1_LEPSM